MPNETGPLCDRCMLDNNKMVQAAYDAPNPNPNPWLWLYVCETCYQGLPDRHKRLSTPCHRSAG